MDRIKIEPGSPEDRILTATIEGVEASGIVLTSKEKKFITAFFMMGYTAGLAVETAKNGGIDIEIVVQRIIAGVNVIAFERM